MKRDLAAMTIFKNLSIPLVYIFGHTKGVAFPTPDYSPIIKTREKI